MNGRQSRKLRYESHVSTTALLAVLSGETRFEILQLLAGGPVSVGGIAESLELAVNLVSHNLRVMREYRLARCERDGTVHLYQLGSRVRIVEQRGERCFVFTADDGGVVRVAVSVECGAGNPAASPGRLAP